MVECTTTSAPSSKGRCSAGEAIGNLRGVVAHLAHAQVERLEALQQHPRIERRERRPGVETDACMRQLCGGVAARERRMRSEECGDDRLVLVGQLELLTRGAPADAPFIMPGRDRGDCARSLFYDATRYMAEVNLVNGQPNANEMGDNLPAVALDTAPV